MDIIVKSSNGISLVPLESRLLSDRKLFIEGEITTALAGRFAKAAMLLQKEDSEKPIDIYINSPGGAVDAGLLIYDTIKGMPDRTALHCMGMAGSVAAIILAGGKKGLRHILPHSRVMIHEPLIPGDIGGSATHIKRMAESILETKRIAVELLAADTGKSEKEIEEAIAFDHFMNAQEAVAFGLCDRIETAVA